MARALLPVLVIGALAAPVTAGEIPIITLTDVGPDQELPTDRSFYVVGDASSSVEHVQAMIVRRGSPSMFGTDGPSCHDLLADLRLDIATSTAADDEEGEDDDAVASVEPRYDAGLHRAFEIFTNAIGDSRRAPVLVTPAWRRPDLDARQFKILIPHERDFFSAGYGYCLFVVTTEHAQEVDDTKLVELVDGIASKIVGCGDKGSCDEEALNEYEVRAAKVLARSRTISVGPPGHLRVLAGRLREAARAELGTATGIIEALDRIRDHWQDKTNVMTPAASSVWADTKSDPFARSTAALLARAGALLPQVRTQGTTSSVALFTVDGKLNVSAVQLLDDGRSIRVASTAAPKSDQARVLTATTDTLVVADGITLYDLIQLGQRRIRVDNEWVTLKALGERVAGLGLDTWMPEDASFLAAATAHMKRLADFVDLTTTGLSCGQHAYTASEAELSTDAVRRHLGEWLVCQRADAGALETMREQLATLGHEDETWQATKDKVVARSRRIVTLTTTAPTETRVSFASRTWLFSYVTPIVGYAGVLRPDETFGLFYLGAQIHLDPNPAADVLWRRGVTVKDLRRALALELGISPTRSSFGPEMRYDGPGSLPPMFAGVAVHVLPYTSLTFGGAIVERRHSTLREEEPTTIVSPYLGFTIQLNVPDMIRHAAGPSTDTTASR